MSAGETHALWRAAQTLGRLAGRRKGLPPLLLFTDPQRTPDPQRLVAGLPQGAGVVFRPFGAPNRLETGRALADRARTAGVVFIVGADRGLAVALRADGVHLPERAAGRCGLVKALRRRFLVTAAAHSWPAVLRAQRAGVDAVVVSPVFPSASPSAGRPMGALRFAAMAKRARAPLYALGGVNAETVTRLRWSGAAGIAAIGGLIV